MMSALPITVAHVPGDRLDPDSQIPLFYQLFLVLRDRILSGCLEPGDQMPSEAELCATYGISRTTVRQAIDRLVAMEHVRRRHGKGTFVESPQPKWGLVMDPSWSRAMRTRGVEPEILPLCLERQPASELTRRYLDLTSDTVVHLRRLVNGSGEPWALSEHFVDSALGLKDEELATGIVADLLAERFGVRIGDSICLYLEPVLIEAEDAELLEVTPGSAGLLVARQVRDTHGRAVLYSRSLFRGDRCRLLFSSV
jgi:GntR family transcriptional regulator